MGSGRIEALHPLVTAILVGIVGFRSRRGHAAVIHGHQQLHGQGGCEGMLHQGQATQLTQAAGHQIAPGGDGEGRRRRPSPGSGGLDRLARGGRQVVRGRQPPGIAAGLLEARMQTADDLGIATQLRRLVDIADALKGFLQEGQVIQQIQQRRAYVGMDQGQVVPVLQQIGPIQRQAGHHGQQRRCAGLAAHLQRQRLTPALQQSGGFGRPRLDSQHQPGLPRIALGGRAAASAGQVTHRLGGAGIAEPRERGGQAQIEQIVPGLQQVHQAGDQLAQGLLGGGCRIGGVAALGHSPRGAAALPGRQQLPAIRLEARDQCRDGGWHGAGRARRCCCGRRGLRLGGCRGARFGTCGWRRLGGPR